MYPTTVEESEDLFLRQYSQQWDSMMVEDDSVVSLIHVLVWFWKHVVHIVLSVDWYDGIRQNRTGNNMVVRRVVSFVLEARRAYCAFS